MPFGEEERSPGEERTPLRRATALVRVAAPMKAFFLARGAKRRRGGDMGGRPSGEGQGDGVSLARHGARDWQGDGERDERDEIFAARLLLLFLSLRLLRCREMEQRVLAVMFLLLFDGAEC